MAALALFGALALLMVAPPVAAVAAPTDSPILIRLVDPAVDGNASAERVMLQMTVDGQQDQSGAVVQFYGPNGALTGTFTIPGPVPIGLAGRTILLAPASSLPAPDFDIGGVDRLSPVGGGVCFVGESEPDCVTWGSFPSVLWPTLPDSPTGNAPALLTGQLLGRTIASGCLTWLGPPDDTGDGAGDFRASGPQPRNNAMPPPTQPPTQAEFPCQLETGFNQTPANPTNDTTATFAFGEVPADYATTFMCSFQKAPFALCDPDGISFGPLPDGFYNFRAFAQNGAGPDPTPLSWTWEVDTVPPDTTITQTPPPISSGFAASFSFVSSEPEPGFVCRLDNGPIQVCTPGETYFFLSEGTHTFRVWSSDQATNRDPTAAQHEFLVDTSFGDITAPFTQIVSAPPKNSKTAAARFAYSSNEPGSRFECRVDSAPFSACEPTGMTYPGLRNGRHTFAVRAIDRAGNTDGSPALHTWTIEAASPETEITKNPPGITRLKSSKRLAAVRFAFRSTKANSSFHCRLDGKPFQSCESPRRLRVKPGRHRFEVYATDALGNRDDSPATRIFRVMRKGAGKGVFR